MLPRQDGMAIEHAGAGIFHYRPDLFSHARFIAMNSAFRAFEHIFFQRAIFKALFDIIEQLQAFRTQAFSTAMMSMAVEINHQLGCFDFLFHL